MKLLKSLETYTHVKLKKFDEDDVPWYIVSTNCSTVATHNYGEALELFEKDCMRAKKQQIRARGNLLGSKPLRRYR